ncbi:hypothetical protein EV356DRAFT_52276 [Viridothelium virens]|uniref:Uncharacterized protein n=1 Tax=Viridothelium virens TaxID=1048519 RepID=A0A6A6HG20_VIRVR|nr:hypothetical protein EV356DRAFT_52276 [Viridothelium virens]
MRTYAVHDSIQYSALEMTSRLPIARWQIPLFCLCLIPSMIFFMFEILYRSISSRVVNRFKKKSRDYKRSRREHLLSRRRALSDLENGAAIGNERERLSFLKVPPEIRQQVYEYLFREQEREPIVMTYDVHRRIVATTKSSFWRQYYSRRWPFGRKSPAELDVHEYVRQRPLGLPMTCRQLKHDH